MIALLRLVIILLIVQTIIYVALSFYSRAVRRSKLEADWDDGAGTTSKETFVEEGLKEYDSSLRRKLILGVYIVPFVIISVLVYVSNQT
jgi:uncharacterized ion transporter superfamily protein YfcC